MTTKNFAVQIGNDLLYFPTWFNLKFESSLFYVDINQDGLKDIIVVLISEAGSGLSTKEIHILRPSPWSQL